MIRSIESALSNLLSVLILATACGCVEYVDTSCTSFQPITYSAKLDTPDTVDGVRRHNAAWLAICKK